MQQMSAFMTIWIAGLAQWRGIATKHSAFCICLFALFTYFAIWNWSYLPATEGWFIASSMLMSEGKRLYVDFFAYLPPIYYLLTWFIAEVFQNSLDAFRTIGLLVHLNFCNHIFAVLLLEISKISIVAQCTISIVVYDLWQCVYFL